MGHLYCSQPGNCIVGLQKGLYARLSPNQEFWHLRMLVASLAYSGRLKLVKSSSLGAAEY
jgi:hypothetical protein